MSPKAFANTKCQQERRGMLKTIFLAINGMLPGAIVVLFAGNSSLLLKLTLLHQLQKAFDDKRLTTCSAEYQCYQQLRDILTALCALWRS